MEKDYKNIRIEEYAYHLPDDRIAKYPEEIRDKSKLLYYSNERINTLIFNQLPELLNSGDLLIFNNAKVIQARLEFKKETGASIEVFCLEPFNPSDYNLAFQAQNQCEWKCLVGNLKKWKNEILQKQIEIDGVLYQFKAEKSLHDNTNEFQTSGNANGIIVKFSWQIIDNKITKNLSFGDILENSGSTPLPPYLNRKAELEDKIRYQTIYARQKGSVAAPTAGLHFTDNVLEVLENKGISRQFITLHVSAGTFRPIKSETIEGHEMHEEHFELDQHTLDKLINHTGRIIAVGTTSVRSLESLYWIGVKLHTNKLNPFFIEQWEVYEYQSDIKFKDSLLAIQNYLKENQMEKLTATTRIIIVPGYKFKVIAGLITNFHQPQSTLLLLISAVVGEKWKEIYGYALANNYRFLSYGDSSLLMIET